MIIQIDYDPEMHEIVELDVTRSLRLATGFTNLVTYRHKVVKTWVIALLSRGGKMKLGEIDLLGTGEGEGPWISRKHFKNVVRKLRHTIATKEASRRIGSRRREIFRGVAEVNNEHAEGCRGMHEHIKRTKGNVAAERYANNVGTLITDKKIGA